MLPKFYELLAGGGPAVTFRVSSGGRYDRWDLATRNWIHIVGAAGRDYLSRAIENGEAVRRAARF